MSSFTLQVLSDIHIEFKNNDVPNYSDILTPSSPNLILAGDIGSFYKYDQLKGFLETLSPLYTNIIYVLGNHEYYRPRDIVVNPLTISTIRAMAQNLQSSISNLYILDNATVRLGDYWIIGSTLWSDLKCELPKNIVKIYGMNTEIYKSKFENSVTFIKNEVKKCKEKNCKAIVVTHYVPTYSSINQDYKRSENKYVSLYVSNLDYLIKDDTIHTWISGHTHKNFNYNLHNTNIVSNQKGKPKDNILDYKKDFVLQFS